MASDETDDVEMLDDDDDVPTDVLATPIPMEKPALKKTATEERELLFIDLLNCVSLITKGVETSNDRLIGRAIRLAFRKRSQFSERVLRDLVSNVLVDESDPTGTTDRQEYLLPFVSSEMDIDDVPPPPRSFEPSQPQQRRKIVVRVTNRLPLEVELFLSLLILVYLLDRTPSRLSESVELSSNLVDRLWHVNRVATNQLRAKLFFYYSLCHERVGLLGSIRSSLLRAFRLAVLRKDRFGQSTLLNCVLRSFLVEGRFVQADQILAQTDVGGGGGRGGRGGASKASGFTWSSNAQEARFQYYRAWILAIQLDYSDALEGLQLALRKSPKIAKGFRLVVTKLSIIVQLLMGDVPERTVFSHPEFVDHLKPYFELTNMVRQGDVNGFQEVLESARQVFTKDRTFTLCQRIRKNVIRTGLNKIRLSYSRISFTDMCKKLRLQRPEDMECIVAKAIRDNILDATIDHEGGYMMINPTPDTYATLEPSKSMNERIRFCMGIHNQCIRAMRYPMDDTPKKEDAAASHDVDDVE